MRGTASLLVDEKEDDVYKTAHFKRPPGSMSFGNGLLRDLGANSSCDCGMGCSSTPPPDFVRDALELSGPKRTPKSCSNAVEPRRTPPLLASTEGRGAVLGEGGSNDDDV